MLNVLQDIDAFLLVKDKALEERLPACQALQATYNVAMATVAGGLVLINGIVGVSLAFQDWDSTLTREEKFLPPTFLEVNRNVTTAGLVALSELSEFTCKVRQVFWVTCVAMAEGGLKRCDMFDKGGKRETEPIAVSALFHNALGCHTCHTPFIHPATCFCHPFHTCDTCHTGQTGQTAHQTENDF